MGSDIGQLLGMAQEVTTDMARELALAMVWAHDTVVFQELDVGLFHLYQDLVVLDLVMAQELELDTAQVVELAQGLGLDSKELKALET